MQGFKRGMPQILSYHEKGLHAKTAELGAQLAFPGCAVISIVLPDFGQREIFGASGELCI